MEDGIEQYMPLLPKIVKPVTTIVTPTAIKQEQENEKLIDIDHNPSTMLHMTTDYSQETSVCNQAEVSFQSIPPIRKPITPPFSWQRDH
jgi:hypothetical protein